MRRAAVCEVKVSGTTYVAVLLEVSDPRIPGPQTEAHRRPCQAETQQSERRVWSQTAWVCIRAMTKLGGLSQVHNLSEPRCSQLENGIYYKTYVMVVIFCCDFSFFRVHWDA